MIEENGRQWVFDPDGSFSHVLADTGTAAAPGALVTMCGRELPGDHTSTFSVPPSLAICPGCRRAGRVTAPPAVFPTPTHY